MMDHLSLYKGFGSFLILAFTSSSARCSTTRVILAMSFSLSLPSLSCSRKSYHLWLDGIRVCIERGKPAERKKQEEQTRKEEAPKEKPYEQIPYKASDLSIRRNRSR